MHVMVFQSFKALRKPQVKNFLKKIIQKFAMSEKSITFATAFREMLLSF